MDSTTQTKPNDKIAFVLGFLALLLALSPLESNLSETKIKIFGTNPSISELLIIMTGMLFFAIYLYAVYYSAVNFKTLSTWKIFKLLYQMGEGVYFITVLFPPFIIISIFLSYLTSELASKLDSNSINTYLTYLGVIGGLVGGAIGWYTADRSLKYKQETLVEEIDELVYHSILRSKEAFDKKLYNYSIIELNNALFNSLYKRLVSISFLPGKKFNDSELLDLSIKNKIVKNTEIQLITDLKALRNKLAHGKLQRSIAKDTTLDYIEKIEKLIERIEKRA